MLKDRWVLAAGHPWQDLTTASMLAWVLEYAKLEPGFIGGVPGNFPVSARLWLRLPFVIEADEYDCAFFDKRSKFVHYHPRTLVMNNLELTTLTSSWIRRHPAPVPPPDAHRAEQRPGALPQRR